MLDIIIPVYNEEKILREKEVYFLTLKKYVHLIFVDAGSQDKTSTIAQVYGTVLNSSKGRGCQKNAGAAAALTNFLLFLHVDTSIQTEAISVVVQALNSGSLTGCLTLRIDDKFWIFRIFEWLVNIRAKVFGVMDGDLGFFIRKDIFVELGQFDHVPFMEDILFSKKLRPIKSKSILSTPIYVSSRKWHEDGFFQTFLTYAKAYYRFWTASGEFQKS